LIIFMITAPLMSHRIKVPLPNANPKTPDTGYVETMDLAVRQDGTMYLNDAEVSEVELKARFAVAAAKTPQPEIQLRADKDTEYRYVRKILGDAKAAGMVHVGFMTTGKEKDDGFQFRKHQRPDGRHQRYAAGRRDAGAADHLHDHGADAHPQGEGRLAAAQQQHATTHHAA
jgi:biopolymer transport protein ExbD